MLSSLEEDMEIDEKNKKKSRKKGEWEESIKKMSNVKKMMRKKVISICKPIEICNSIVNNGNGRREIHKCEI